MLAFGYYKEVWIKKGEKWGCLCMFLGRENFYGFLRNSETAFFFFIFFF